MCLIGLALIRRKQPPVACLARPQLNGPAPITVGLCPSCREAYQKLSSVSLSTSLLSLSPVVAPGPPLPTLLCDCLSLYTGRPMQQHRPHGKRRQAWSMHRVLILKHYWIYFGCLRVPSGTLGARPQLASALSPCVLQISPPFSSLSVEGVTERDERGMLGKRETQRGSGVVSLVTTTSSATAAVVVNVPAAGRRVCIGVASSDGRCPWDSGRRICL
jgi:hypothetical protein